MGTRTSEQAPLWIAASKLPKSPGHPFYVRLGAVLDAHDFDGFVEDLCSGFYAPVMGRPSLAPGRYFRLLLIGYFEGLDAERGIPGARPIRSRSAVSCGWRWTRPRPITRRFPGRGA
jgi:transposase